MLGCGLANERDILLEEFAADIVYAHADAAVVVLGAANQCCDEARVRFFVAGAGAIFAIEGDIKNGAKLLLQDKRFKHQLFGAGIMIADRKIYRLLPALK